MTRPPSLLRAMVAWQVIAMLLAWVVLSAWLVYQMMDFGHGDLDRRMQTFAGILAETASTGPHFDDALQRRLVATEHIFVDGILTGFDAIDGYVPLYQVRTHDGALRYASAGAVDLPMPWPPGFTRFEHDGHRYRAVGVPSNDGSIRVTMAERDDQRLASPALKVIGLSQLLILLWCLAVTGLAARRGFRPLQALADQLSMRRAGDLAPLQATRLYAETAPVVREVNALLAREADRLETERGFLADAAHELRTPLAAINAQAHLLAGSSDAATRAGAVADLEAGMDRVSHLLAQLLTMARIEAGPVAAEPEVLDVAELCRQRLAPLSRLARARAIELRLEAPDRLTVATRRTNLISLIDNLVDNAIRYTPSGGRVEVRLTSDADGYVLQVRDDGPGIAVDDRQRVFERFVRLPGHVESGSGLGLAIVHRVVAAENAALEFVEGLSGRGIGFSVRMAATTGTR